MQGTTTERAVLFTAKQSWRFPWTLSSWHGSRAASYGCAFRVADADRRRAGRAASHVSRAERACQPRDPKIPSSFPSRRRRHHPSIQPSPSGIQSAPHALLVWLRPWPRRPVPRWMPAVARQPPHESGIRPKGGRAPTRPAPRQSVFPGVLAVAFPREIMIRWHTHRVPSPTW